MSREVGAVEDVIIQKREDDSSVTRNELDVLTSRFVRSLYARVFGDNIGTLLDDEGRKKQLFEKGAQWKDLNHEEQAYISCFEGIVPQKRKLNEPDKNNPKKRGRLEGISSPPAIKGTCEQTKAIDKTIDNVQENESRRQTFRTNANKKSRFVRDIDPYIATTEKRARKRKKRPVRVMNLSKNQDARNIGQRKSNDMDKNHVDSDTNFVFGGETTDDKHKQATQGKPTFSVSGLVSNNPNKPPESAIIDDDIPMRIKLADDCVDILPKTEDFSYEYDIDMHSKATPRDLIHIPVQQLCELCAWLGHELIEDRSDVNRTKTKQYKIDSLLQIGVTYEEIQYLGKDVIQIIMEKNLSLKKTWDERHAVLSSVPDADKELLTAMHYKILSIKNLRNLFVYKGIGYSMKRSGCKGGVIYKKKNGQIIRGMELISALLERGLTFSDLDNDEKEVLLRTKASLVKTKSKLELSSSNDLYYSEFVHIDFNILKDLYVLKGLGSYEMGSELHLVRDFEGSHVIKKSHLIEHLLWFELTRGELKVYVNGLLDVLAFLDQEKNTRSALITENLSLPLNSKVKNVDSHKEAFQGDGQVDISNQVLNRDSGGENPGTGDISAASSSDQYIARISSIKTEPGEFDIITNPSHSIIVSGNMSHSDTSNHLHGVQAELLPKVTVGQPVTCRNKLPAVPLNCLQTMHGESGTLSSKKYILNMTLSQTAISGEFPPVNLQNVASETDPKSIKGVSVSYKEDVSKVTAISSRRDIVHSETHISETRAKPCAINNLSVDCSTLTKTVASTTISSKYPHLYDSFEKYGSSYIDSVSPVSQKSSLDIQHANATMKHSPGKGQVDGILEGNNHCIKLEGTHDTPLSPAPSSQSVDVPQQIEKRENKFLFPNVSACDLIHVDLNHLIDLYEKAKKTKGTWKQFVNEDNQIRSKETLINELLLMKITEEELGDALIYKINVSKLYLQVQWDQRNQLPKNTDQLTEIHCMFLDNKLIRELFTKKNVGQLTRISRGNFKFTDHDGNIIMEKYILPAILEYGITKDELSNKSICRLKHALNKLRYLKSRIPTVTQLCALDIFLLPFCLIRDLYVLKGLGNCDDVCRRNIKTFTGSRLKKVELAVDQLLWIGLSVDELKTYVDDVFYRFSRLQLPE